jgi:large subunit ribosomal protein L25
MATATTEKRNTEKQNEDKRIEAKPRQSGTKNDARRVRKAGLVPAVLYGAGLDPKTVTVDPKQIRRILNSETGHNSIFDLAVAGDSDAGKAMIVDWQFEPIKGALLHVDLKRIAMDKLLRVSVPVIFKGEAPGVKLQGGILEQVLREIEIECLPADIPGHIDADVSNLNFGDSIRVSDLPKNDKVKILTDEGQTVVHVTAVKEEVVATPAAEAEAAATTAEPEVIKKGKQDEGEAAEGGKGEKSEKGDKSEKKK